MQCDKTKLGIRSDSPVAVAASEYGANINATGFNIDFIAERDPNMVKQIFRLYKRAKRLEKAKPCHKFEERFDPNVPATKDAVGA